MVISINVYPNLFIPIINVSGTFIDTLALTNRRIKSVKNIFWEKQISIVNMICYLVGFPKLYWSGKEGDHNIMVMELLGKNLEEQMKIVGKKLTMKTILLIADQMIKRIETLHSKDYIHRDIKPENFCVGYGKLSNLLYFIDFGLSKRYRDPVTKAHVPQTNHRGLTGTARYASINAHLGVQQSRRDDLEAIGYVLLYLLRGELPWQGVKAATKHEKYQLIMEKKMSMTTDLLCNGLPNEFQTYMQLVMDLGYEEKPNYDFYRQLFKNVYQREGYDKEEPLLDWIIIQKVQFDRQYDFLQQKKDMKMEEKKKLKIEVTKEEDLGDGPQKNELLLKVPSPLKHEISSKTSHRYSNPESNNKGVVNHFKELLKIKIQSQIQKELDYIEVRKVEFKRLLARRFGEILIKSPISNQHELEMSVESQGSLPSFTYSEQINHIDVRNFIRHNSLLCEEQKLHSKRILVEKIIKMSKSHKCNKESINSQCDEDYGDENECIDEGEEYEDEEDDKNEIEYSSPNKGIKDNGETSWGRGTYDSPPPIIKMRKASRSFKNMDEINKMVNEVNNEQKSMNFLNLEAEEESRGRRTMQGQTSINLKIDNSLDVDKMNFETRMSYMAEQERQKKEKLLDQLLKLKSHLEAQSQMQSSQQSKEFSNGQIRSPKVKSSSKNQILKRSHDNMNFEEEMNKININDVNDVTTSQESSVSSDGNQEDINFDKIDNKNNIAREQSLKIDFQNPDSPIKSLPTQMKQNFDSRPTDGSGDLPLPKNTFIRRQTIHKLLLKRRSTFRPQGPENIRLSDRQKKLGLKLSDDNLTMYQKSIIKEQMKQLNDYYSKGASSQTHQTTSLQVETYQSQQAKKDNILIKLLKKYRCCKYREEGDEDEFDHITTIPYSSGESDEEITQAYKKMSIFYREYRVRTLWSQVFSKAKGASMIIFRFGDLNRRIYMYGTAKRLDIKEDYQFEPSWFVIMPEYKFKLIWNIVVVLLLFYTATFVPYRTAFIDTQPQLLTYFEWVIDILFIVDLFINFLSAYEDRDKNIEVRIRMICANYIKTWFFLDVIACIPFQFLENESPNKRNINKLLRLARLPRLYRLLRILRLFKMVRLFKYNTTLKKLVDIVKLNSGIARMLGVTVTVLFMVHLMSCFWFLVARFNDFSPDTWVAKLGVMDQSDSYLYLCSIYWVIQTLTTVGYGDIHACNDAERFTALLWMIFGVGFYSFTIGNLSSIINNIDVKAAHLQQKLNELQEFAKRTKLSDDVQQRIKRFLENNHNEHLSLFDQKQLMNELPASLRAEVVKHTHGEIIKKIKFFNDKELTFLWQIIPMLKPMKVYQKDILYNQGDHAEELFFILRGRVKLYYDISEGQGDIDNVPFNIYVEGSYFGDSDVLINSGKNGRDGTAEAEVECQLLVITRKELKNLLKKFPHIRKEMIKVAKERKKHHETAIKEIIQKRKEQNQGKQTNYAKEKKDTQENQQRKRTSQMIMAYKQSTKKSSGKKSAQQNIIKMFKSITKKSEDDNVSEGEDQSLKGKNLHDDLQQQAQDLSRKIKINNPSPLAIIKLQQLEIDDNSRDMSQDQDKQMTQINISQFSGKGKNSSGNVVQKEQMRNSAMNSRESSSANIKIDLKMTEINSIQVKKESTKYMKNTEFPESEDSVDSGSVSSAEEDIIPPRLTQLEDNQYALQQESQINQFKNFTDNMSLVALNAYEIYQLYEIINKESEKINEGIKNLEQHNQMIESRSEKLEEKLENLLKLI